MFITLPSSYLLDYENGEDVYEDYELSSDNQTVNQTNGAGLQNNQVSLGSLKTLVVSNITRKLNDYFNYGSFSERERKLYNKFVMNTF